MSTQFIVALVPANSADGQLKKIDKANFGDRCVADEAVKAYFNPKSTIYRNVLKACRWLREEPGAVRATLEGHRGMQYMVIAI